MALTSTQISQAHFLTIALASSRIDGIERILYRAPFTYGCIFKGRKQVIGKFSNTIQLNYQTSHLKTIWLTRRVSLPSSQLSRAPECMFPNDRHLHFYVLVTATAKSSKPSSSFPPKAYSCYVSLLVTLVIPARTFGVTEPSLVSPVFSLQAIFDRTLKHCCCSCSDITIHDLGYIKSPKGSLYL